MTKAATLAAVPLCGMFLFVAAPLAWPQPAAPGVDTAVNEALYRQANFLSLQKKLADAKAAQDRNEMAAAAKLYDDCWDLIQKIGMAQLPKETEQTKAGLADVRLGMARYHQSHKKWREANRDVEDVLRVDPKNPDALAFKAANDKILAEEIRHLPSPEVLDQITNIVAQHNTNTTRVQDGKLLFEMGKLDEAEKILKQVVREDPQNQAAYYYLNLINGARYTTAIKARDEASRAGLVEVAQEWASPPKRELLPIPNPYGRTNLIFTGKGRQAIAHKLDIIRLDNVNYDGLPLGEVIKTLSDEAKKRDPEKRGLNFILNPNVDTGGSPVGQVTDPTTGQLVPAVAPAEAVDMTSIGIKLSLSDVRLADVLDAVVKVADKPIKYSIEEYAVVFSLKSREPVPLYLRVFKVDPNTFYQGLQSVGAFVFGETSATSGGGGGGGGLGGGGGGGRGGGGQNQNTVSGSIISRVSAAPGGVQGGRGGGQQGGGVGGGGGGGGLRFLTTTNFTLEVQESVLNFFTTLGVNLREPGKSVYFNDREGRLLVRASLQDLDIIEAAIQVLNIAPPQVNIKAKFVEVSQNDAKALGFDWYLGNVLMNGGRIGGQGGTAPSASGIAAPNPGFLQSNPSGTFPGTLSGATPTIIPPSPTDQKVTGGLRNPTDALFTLTGILTDPQFRLVIHALEQRDGADILSAPEVTIISGRQAQMKAVEIQTVITAFDFSQQVGGLGVGGAGGGGGGGLGR